MTRHKTKQNWQDWLIRSYLILTVILGFYSFFHLARPTSGIIFIYELVYLILSFILVISFLIRLNLFLIKIKRNNLHLQPLKFHLHSLNFWFIITWTGLVTIYGFQSGGTLFGNLALVSPAFLNQSLFRNLITVQFVLTNYLLFSAILIFIYAIILYQKNGLKIKIVPNNFCEIDSTCLVKPYFFSRNWKKQLFAFIRYFEAYLVRLHPLLALLDLELKHRKTLALRQFKKETTPPAIPLFN